MALSALDRTARLSARASRVVLLLGPAFGACSNDASVRLHDADSGVLHDAGAVCPHVEAPFDREVSFEGDLVPFFAVSCAFDGCHNERSREAGLFLGLNFKDGTPDAAMQSEIWGSLVAMATTTDMPRVTPFAPERSFVMLKVQGCQNAVGLTCRGSTSSTPCGARMPAISDPLSDGKRAMLSRWIADGASFSVRD
jgi:hypothetical protein